MPTVKYKVILEQQEREALREIVKKGKGGAFKIRRAQILLHSDYNNTPTCASQIARDRAENIAESHQRVRSITKEGKVNVEPQLPLDILGVYILQPKSTVTSDQTTNKIEIVVNKSGEP
jgi:hypothetical protein